VAEWVGSKAQVLVLNRVDMILPQAQVWMKWFKAQGSTLISPMPKMVCGMWHRRRKSWGEINQRRRDRGMLPRPVRAVVIGFPMWQIGAD